MITEQKRFVNPQAIQVPEPLRQLDPTITSYEVAHWINSFRFGQVLAADMHGRLEITPYKLVSYIYDPETGGIVDNGTGYLHGQNLIVSTYKAVCEGIWVKRHDLVGTLANLEVYKLFFKPDELTILSGVEEESHSIFAQQIEPAKIRYTGRYDGSDTVEVQAQKDLLSVLEKHNIPSCTVDGYPIVDVKEYVRFILSGLNL